MSKELWGFHQSHSTVQDSTAIDYKNAFAIHKELTNYLYDAWNWLVLLMQALSILKIEVSWQSLSRWQKAICIVHVSYQQLVIKPNMARCTCSQTHLCSPSPQWQELEVIHLFPHIPTLEIKAKIFWVIISSDWTHPPRSKCRKKSGCFVQIIPQTRDFQQP